MSDPGFVVAAYAIVVGGLVLYVSSVTRRAREARRMAEALREARERDRPGAATEPRTRMPQPSEPPP